MLRTLSALVLSAGLLTGCAQTRPSLDQQLDGLMQTLPGSYAGEAPNVFSPDREMQAIFHKIAPIDAPQFGEQVVYYQMSTESADGPPMQMKVFVFDVDPARAANTMQAYVFAPGQAAGNLEQNPDRIAALTPDALMTFPKACGFTWSPVDGGFEGVAPISPCTYPSRAFNQDIRPEMTYRILGDRFELEEALYGEGGEAIVATDGVLPAFRE